MMLSHIFSLINWFDLVFDDGQVFLYVSAQLLRLFTNLQKLFLYYIYIAMVYGLICLCDNIFKRILPPLF